MNETAGSDYALKSLFASERNVWQEVVVALEFEETFAGDEECPTFAGHSSKRMTELEIIDINNLKLIIHFDCFRGAIKFHGDNFLWESEDSRIKHLAWELYIIN